MPDQLLAMVSPELVDDVARCAAASGYTMVSPTTDTARRAWSEATAVVVDTPMALAIVDAGWPRRRSVLVVGINDIDPQSWKSALRLGAENGFALPVDEHLVVGELSRFRQPRRGAGAAIAVLGAHGGAGASVLAASIALRSGHSQWSLRPMLVDLDDTGGGIDLLLGCEEHPGLRWPDLRLDGGQIMADSLRSAVPVASKSVAVLCPRRGVEHNVGIDTAVAIIDAARDGGDLAIVDLPRRSDAVVHAVVEAVDLVLIVTTATVRGCAATRDVAQRWREITDSLALVVRGPAPGGLTAQRIAATTQLELIAAVRSTPDVVAGIEVGRIPLKTRSPLVRASDLVLQRLNTSTRIAA